jgi:hypothetical protein
VRFVPAAGTDEESMQFLDGIPLLLSLSIKCIFRTAGGKPDEFSAGEQCEERLKRVEVYERIP